MEDIEGVLQHLESAGIPEIGITESQPLSSVVLPKSDALRYLYGRKGLGLSWTHFVQFNGKYIVTYKSAMYKTPYRKIE